MFSKKFAMFIDLWRYAYGAERSIDDKVCADASGDELPWYTYPAIEFLRQFDYRQKSVFEFGAGYSSAFWAKRASKVTAVENDEGWLKKWQSELQLSNLQLLYRPELSDYAAAIAGDEKYDVIAIDGKSREECAFYAVQYLADGGMIILDDSDRANKSQEYQKAIERLREAGLLQIDFFGCCPMNSFTKATSIFFKRDFNFSTLNKIQPANAIGNLWSKTRRERKEFYKAGQGMRTDYL
ncbi:MAG: class I SAM-dependent methyltransferase [Alphaproteobacteria bacterium]|nr:class I SAM-dependent methyltransferase [Alphaproteobacteria bacterium]